MSDIFRKNFNQCFPKFKCPLTTILCTPPPSKQDDHYNHPPPSNTTFSSTSPMIKNFNSLYDFTTSGSTSKSTDNFSSSEDYSDYSETMPPDFVSLIASQRFFFSSPGRSNSIFESSLPENPLPESDALLTGSVAIPKYSPDPYKDFRRSMQEMVEAMKVMNARDNWESLHELLLCYLSLNPKTTHNIIIKAFSDLVVSLMSSTDNVHRNLGSGNRRQHVSRRLML